MLKFLKCIGCILLLAILFTSLFPAAVVYAKAEEEEVGTLESMIAKMLNGLANAVNKIISLVLRSNGIDR